jgi:calcineurin-like phosphoesterase family protein
MSQIFYTSDLHLSHLKPARIRNPEFEGKSDEAVVQAHDDEILESLMRLPRFSQLHILGDLSRGKGDHEDAALNVLAQVALDRSLELHLIAGNHDSVHPMHRDALKEQAKFGLIFKSIQAFAVRRWAKSVDTEFLLSHFPYDGDTEGRDTGDRHTQYRLRDERRPVVHGHTHGTYKTSRSKRGTLQVHVGFDAWRRPIALEEIVEILKAG